MSFGNIDVINSWKYLNFINSENDLVIFATMKSYMHQDLLSVWLTKVQVSGRLLGHGKVGKTMTKAKIYHVKEPNLMRRVSWL